MSMHFLLLVDACWFAMRAAAALSMCSAASVVWMPISDIMLRVHIVCVAASAAAMYSASHVLFATMGCCLACQFMVAPLSVMAMPETDFVLWCH